MYPPSQDSFFLAQFLENYISNLKNKNIKYLDMGTGSGILAQTAEKAGISRKNITAADIDQEAITKVKNLGFKTIKSNLFQNIKDSYDLITFNAPYLPEHKHDKKPDTTGGKHGDETALEFLKQAKPHLNPDGKIFLLISSHTRQKEIKKHKPIVKKRKKLFFEELLILELS